MKDWQEVRALKRQQDMKDGRAVQQELLELEPRRWEVKSWVTGGEAGLSLHEVVEGNASSAKHVGERHFSELMRRLAEGLLERAS